MTQRPATDECAEAVQGRRRALLAWYDAQGRDLPWRRRRSLYGTWISEIMLQQTTVAAVEPRWEAFLARFPDVASLAAAPESEVLAAWSGLGYYRRARHLHAAARRIVAAGGALPRSRDRWRELPGVGDYAAAAIASIGLQQREAAIDANVRRVITRWICSDEDAAASLSPRDLRIAAATHVPAGRPGDWNQALMDLGSATCRADVARCDACPVRTWCAARAAGRAALVLPPAARAAMRDVSLAVLVARAGRDVLLLEPAGAMVAPVPTGGPPIRRAMGALFGGTPCLPSTWWYPRDDRAAPALVAALGAWLAERGERQAVVRPAGQVRHTVTRHRLMIEVAVADVDPARIALPGGAKWYPTVGDWPRSTLVGRCLELAGPTS